MLARTSWGLLGLAIARSALAEEPLSDAVWITGPDAAHTQFADCVASAGDVNGDGLDDIVVGSYDAAESSASVFLGSATGPETAAVWIKESNQADSQFGTSVAGAGDVNGDGWDDVMVGAPYFDGGDTDEGKAYIYLGSTYGPESSFAWRTESTQASAHHGYVVASAGDLNNDGHADVLIAAPDYDNTPSGEGKVSVYLGSPTGPLEVADLELVGTQSSANFGWSAASAGDVNGDGFDDLVAGAPDYDNGSTDEGLASVFFGTSDGVQTSAAWTIDSDQTYSDFGYSVASAGDVDADGFDDVIVGARYFDNGETSEGRAFVYYGSNVGLPPAAAWTAEPNDSYAVFGTAVATSGDVNADGYADVVVGAPDYSGVLDDAGKVYVHLGSALGLGVSEDWTAEPLQGDSAFGASVAAAGDVNGDGYGDLVIGSPTYESATKDGAAFVYLGQCRDASADTDGDGVGDACDLCVGDDVSGDVDLDGICANAADGAVEDCNDADPAVYPGAPDLCDGIDNGCHGTVPLDERDLDADGVLACDGDCDDTDPFVFPGALELCDGEISTCAATLPVDELDVDGDGFSPCEGDCDDSHPNVRPVMSETCADGLDNNCDGRVDEECPATSGDGSGKKKGCDATGGAVGGLPLAALALLLRRRSSPPVTKRRSGSAARG